MATGIPRRIARGKNKAAESDFVLQYEGKSPASDILSGDSANLQRLVAKDGKSPGNLLAYSDNLKAMRSLLRSKAGSVQLIYLDPPFATGFDFHSREQDLAYSDELLGSRYLEFLRQRLIVMYELLRDDGSIYVHLDGKMAFTVKVLMDEIFGAKNFRNWITRRKANPKNYTRKTYGNISDYILFYTRSSKYVWNLQTEEISDAQVRREYRYVEKNTGRRYMRVPIHAPGVRNGATGKPWRGMLPPPGKHWQYTPERLDEMDARGEIYWSPTGNPRRKVYLDEHKGVPVQDIWWDFKDAHNQNIKVTGYPTEKNPDLLRRIIRASSNEGDLILDPFSGSGTLADVGSELKRTWIAIDESLVAIDTTIQRLAQGSRRMGAFATPSEPEGHEQLRLFPTTPSLTQGFEVQYDAEGDELEPISEQLLERWRQLLRVQASR